MNLKCIHVFASLVTALTLAIGAPGSLLAAPPDSYVKTKTPIKHVIVIFEENISFDHYFATYPYATNPTGEPAFHAKPHTPRANNLLSGRLLTENPNSVQPFRLDKSQAWTCDQNHDYTPEQQAFDHGLMDKFPQFTGIGGTDFGVECDYGQGTGIVMGYYDGNTVTAWWNYAQHYALSDNFSGTMFGPSSVGAVNLVAGTTSGLTMEDPNGTAVNTVGTIAGGLATGVLIGDEDPWYDDCSSSTRAKVTNGGLNIGDLLNNAGLTWGWFQGGFAPTNSPATPAVCGSATNASASVALPAAAGNVADYVAHHEPFEYYPSTSNPHHVPPNSTIGTTDNANHQYDLSLFTTALNNGELPAVTFIKPKKFQNAHPGNSDPLDEQTFLTATINAVMNSKYWDDTAIIVTYDDSDGWYDHQMDSIVNQSDSRSDDALATFTPAVMSGSTVITPASGTCGVTPAGGAPGRCGYGPRFPMIVISPYAKANYIDHRTTDQSSILRFIEDNWLPEGTFIGKDSSDVKAGSLYGFFDFAQNHDRNGKLILKTTTGEIVPDQDHHHDHDHGDW